MSFGFSLCSYFFLNSSDKWVFRKTLLRIIWIRFNFDTHNLYSLYFQLLDDENKRKICAGEEKLWYTKTSFWLVRCTENVPAFGETGILSQWTNLSLSLVDVRCLVYVCWNRTIFLEENILCGYMKWSQRSFSFLSIIFKIVLNDWIWLISTYVYHKNLIEVFEKIKFDQFYVCLNFSIEHPVRKAYSNYLNQVQPTL